MSGGAWPLFVGGMIALVNPINEQDFDSFYCAMYGSCKDLCASHPQSLNHGGGERAVLNVFYLSGEVCEQAACA